MSNDKVSLKKVIRITHIHPPPWQPHWATNDFTFKLKVLMSVVLVMWPPIHLVHRSSPTASGLQCSKVGGSGIVNHVGYITNHKKRFDFNKFLKRSGTTWRSLSPSNDTPHDLCWVKGNSTLSSHAKYVHVNASSELGIALLDTCVFWEGAHWSWELYTQVHANVFGYDMCNFLTHLPSIYHPFYPYDIKVPRPFLL